MDGENVWLKIKAVENFPKGPENMSKKIFGFVETLSKMKKFVPTCLK